jgi:small subunit ribosomal protein S8
MDTIANMLTKIRNAQLAGHREVNIPASKLKLSLAKILEKEGFVEEIKKERQNNLEKIRVVLRYVKTSDTRKNPAISGIRRISRTGQRIYIKSKDIESVKNKFGIAVVSTSKGLMTGFEAKKQGLGGEYICEVW